MSHYNPNPGRYDSMTYRRCGRSGLRLPLLSLGLWHNFGATDEQENCRNMILTAFDGGITHFDLANNYGPPPGAAEITFGKIFAKDLRAHRDEIIVSSKAGWPMWSGPYGDLGSRKHLIASIDQSLKRTGLEYFDIFYHHRPDPNTPLEETMMALHTMVQSGKALYAGVSSYSPEETKEAAAIMRSLGTPLLLHQPRYSLLDREVEKGLLSALEEEGLGCICFSPLAQGLLTNKYLNGIPPQSRALSQRGNGAIEAQSIGEVTIKTVRALNELAQVRDQSLAQMALAWVLKDERITSVIIGASRPQQILDSLGALQKPNFAAAELDAIERILG